MSKPLDVRVVGALIAALVVLASSAALADAVGPPPASCPPGSTPQSSHAGPLCRPSAECTTDAMCTDGATCGSVSQCIETRDCGGLRPPDSGPCTVEHVVGECGAGDTCAVGVCRARRVCTSGATSGGGCGCRAAGAPSSSPLAAAALMLVGLGGYARARRHPRRV